MLEYVEEQLITIGNGYELHHKGQEVSTRKVKTLIIKYMQSQKMILRRTTIDSYYYYFRSYSTSNYWKLPPEHLYEQIYNDYMIFNPSE